MLPHVNDAKLIRPKSFRDSRGELTVIEFAELVPFPVVRLFYIRDVPAMTKRGGHAHKLCNQLLICQAGKIILELSDGTNIRHVNLSANDALWVLPGLYSSETYLDQSSVLLVLCDRVYEMDDYIKELGEFVQYRRSTTSAKSKDHQQD